MKFHPIDDTTARVDGIPDILVLQQALEDKGQFNANKGLYSMQLPGGGQIVAVLQWWPNALDIRIKQKPWIIPYKAIWAGIKKEIAKSEVLA